MFFTTCPICKKIFPYNGPESMEEVAGATMDCPKCDGLLLIEKDAVKDFHKTMHQQYEKWPEDGKGTGCLTIEENGRTKIEIQQ